MPSLFLGKRVKDSEIFPILQTIRKKFYDSNWHYADEENFIDLVNRVKASLDLIISQKKENIVVVSHGYFLTAMIFYLIFGDHTNPRSFKYFREHTLISNAGLTICEHKESKWKLLVLNDFFNIEEE